jgi:hypothetical protein
MRTNWDLLIENHFARKGKKEESLTLEALLESVREVMGEESSYLLADPSKKILKEAAGNELSWSSIPDVPISEIGWSAMQTRDGIEVPSAERAQLEQFLSRIGSGQDLSEKLAELTSFYNMDANLINELKSGKLNENIAKTISYLVFFKTLTQILTHFNASSAGFSFESFLAVLLGGKQIATNSQTIADLTDANDIPISLKLYKEKKLEVGGSFTDLALDLAKDGWNNTMQYICVTKNLSEGDPMRQEGTLDWYRFNFNIDNVFNILARSSKGSEKNILLPLPFLESGGENIKGLPEKAAAWPHDEELETQFLEFLEAEIKSTPEASFMVDGSALFTTEEIRQALDWAKDGTLFYSPYVRGKSVMKTKQIRKKLMDPEGKFAPYSGELEPLISAANNKLLARHKPNEQKKARQNTVNEMYFYGGVTDKERIEISRKFYEDADFELKKKCLMVSHGYITTGHFKLTQGMIQGIVDLAQPTPGQVLPEGQNGVMIGSLEIGVTNVMSVLREVSSILNENIFEIFNNLKLLTTNIQGYFAGGLEETEKAKTAITAAENIETKTAELAGVTSSKALVPGVGGTRAQAGGRYKVTE